MNTNQILGDPYADYANDVDLSNDDTPDDERGNDLVEANWHIISQWIAEARKPRLVVDNTVAARPTAQVALTPNKADISAHLYALFDPAFVQAYPDAWIEIPYGRPDGNLEAAKIFSAFEPEKAVDFAAAKNAAGFNIYVGAALRHGKRPASGRSNKGHVLDASHAWAEYDGAGDDERIQAILKANNLKPAIVVTTGTVPHTRRHLYFKLDGAVTREKLEAANTALCKLLDSDDVWNPDRIMRLAGTVSYPSPKKKAKRYIPELTTLHANNDADTYKADELIRLGPVSGAISGDPYAEHGKDAVTTGRTDAELVKLLKDSQTGNWHDNMRDAVACLIGRSESDRSIRVTCAAYCDGEIRDADLQKLIDTGRKKFNKPDPVEVPLDRVHNPKPAPKPIPIHATPYAWKAPETIPQREWVYGNLLIRKIVSATISPGGIGKSSLVATEALAMVSGQPLLGVSSPELLRVWLWNLEDQQEETERKIQAAAKHYKLKPDDIGDRLLVDSGRDQKLVIATTTRDGAVIVQPVVDSLVAEIIAHKIDVLIIDPFVSCHEVAENDNPAMDMVVKEWGRVAGRGNCAVHLVHHTRKMGDATEVTTESSRGGSSQTDACRVVRTVNRMTKLEATNAGIDNPRSYFRTFNDKANFAPPVDKSDWFKLDSVDLDNGPMGLPGDSIGVVTKWESPDMTAGMTAADYDKVVAEVRGGKWKESIQAKNWVGVAIAEALGLDLDVPTDKAKVKAALKMYIGAKTLVVVERHDEEQRKLRKFIEVPSVTAH